MNEDLIMKDMHELYVADPVQNLLTVRMRSTVLYPKYDSMSPGCQNYRLDTAPKKNNDLYFVTRNQTTSFTVKILVIRI